MREPHEREEIRGYQAVRAAAKDFEAYSSDLIGDRDTRVYKQVPLEYDPPRHTRFRDAVNPLFLSQNIEPKAPQFERIARELIQGITARGGGDLTTDLALPYVMGCLTVIYNRPHDLDEWISWGPDVWTADAHRQGLVTPESRRAARERSFTGPSLRSGDVLQQYLERVFDAATPAPGADPAMTDVWDWIAGLEIDGERLSPDEMFGIANVLLAGGRDTVIKLITGLTWHLIANPDDRQHLTDNRTAFAATVAELVRFLTPLPKIERVRAADRETPIAERDPRRYVLLNYLSANHDRSIWPDADVLDIRRDRKPHLAFGFGRHSCMGMNITEYEAKAFLTVLLDEWPEWQFDGEPDIEWSTEGEGDAAFTALERFAGVRVSCVTSTPAPRQR